MKKILIFGAFFLGCCSSSEHVDPEEQRHHFYWPLSGHVVQGFYGSKISGEGAGAYYDEHDQIKMFSGPGRMHRAIDIETSKGSAVYAARDGVARRKDWDGVAPYGNCILLDHGHGYYTLYAHLDSIGIADLQAVRMGDEIGKVGSTGNSTGPHLHFEVRHGARMDVLDTPHWVPETGGWVWRGKRLSHYYPELF